LAGWRSVTKEVVDTYNNTPNSVTGGLSPNEITAKNFDVIIDPTILLNQSYGIPPLHPSFQPGFQFKFKM
jgi:hypothetical protein